MARSFYWRRGRAHAASRSVSSVLERGVPRAKRSQIEQQFIRVLLMYKNYPPRGGEFVEMPREETGKAMLLINLLRAVRAFLSPRNEEEKRTGPAYQRSTSFT